MTIAKINEAKMGASRAAELVRQLRLELKRNKGQWARLSRMTDGRLTYVWIKMFAAGEIVEPGAERLFELAFYLGMNITVEGAHHFNRM